MGLLIDAVDISGIGGFVRSCWGEKRSIWTQKRTIAIIGLLHGGGGPPSLSQCDLLLWRQTQSIQDTREVSRSCWTWTCAAFGSLVITEFNVAWTAEIAIWNKSKQRVYY